MLCACLLGPVRVPGGIWIREGKSLKGGGSQDLAEGWNACWIEKKAGNWLRFLALSKMKEGTRLTVG